MSTTNGANHKSVEDLLSSIRSSIGDEGNGLRPGLSTSMPRRDGVLGEDNSEFELPAIFKPDHHHSHARPNNLFGRLSDALKPTMAAEPDRSHTVIRFEPAGGRMIEPPAVAPAADTNATASGENLSSEALNRIAKENSPVKREMAPFMDTRMNRMSAMGQPPVAAEPAEPPPPPAAPQPPPVAAAPVAAAPVAPAPQQPPSEAAPAAGLEDAAAQLLRPILKQWLTENMPKIVEKALRSESGGGFPPPGGNKNGS